MSSQQASFAVNQNLLDMKEVVRGLIPQRAAELNYSPLFQS